MYNSILITGCAGFIGSHLCEYLLTNYADCKIIGLDKLDPYYSIDKKKDNLKILQNFANFTFLLDDIRTTNCITELKPELVIHLAALAGVRNSILEPKRYAEVNIIGLIHLLEQFKNLPNLKNRKFIMASSSSVYGTNKKVPFVESDNLDNINSPYAASKRSMEIYSQTYSQLYNLNIIALRFFTVYGPRGRPDMAPDKFMKSILGGKEITKYGKGNSYRDYTYISDIIEGIVCAIKLEKEGFEIFNLGNGIPITLNQFILTCEKVTGNKAIIKELEEQEGDVPGTYCCRKKAETELGYKPKILLGEGLKKVVI